MSVACRSSSCRRKAVDCAASRSLKGKGVRRNGEVQGGRSTYGRASSSRFNNSAHRAR